MMISVFSFPCSVPLSNHTRAKACFSWRTPASRWTRSCRWWSSSWSRQWSQWWLSGPRPLSASLHKKWSSSQDFRFPYLIDDHIMIIIMIKSITWLIMISIIIKSWSMMIRELSPGPQMLQRRAPSTAGSLASLRLVMVDDDGDDDGRQWWWR